jgi:Nucleotidyl transferase AbiEii toxin, Type IV TA system
MRVVDWRHFWLWSRKKNREQPSVMPPPTEDKATQMQWASAQQEVKEHLLFCLSQSPWQKNLVLRGSITLKAWYGDAARTPGDIDWIVYPSDLWVDSTMQRIFNTLLKTLQQSKRLKSTQLLLDETYQRDIWAYDDAPGHQLIFPWRTADGLEGATQMDIVFGEELPSEPIPLLLTLRDGKEINVLSANKEQSLAWKLLWILSDDMPKGKDLYDAVLLAEDRDVHLTNYLLLKTFRAANAVHPSFICEWIRLLEVDWGDFKPYNASTLQNRLADALEPVFGSKSPP